MLTCLHKSDVLFLDNMKYVWKQHLIHAIKAGINGI